MQLNELERIEYTPFPPEPDQMCEAKLDKLTHQLKTQDSLCSALVTEITIYKSLGKI
jgi:hypothetical protein